MILLDGRFAFSMVRYWGDLRKVIDPRMQQSGNRGSPFSGSTTLTIMPEIAEGIRALHDDNTVHRELKASNALIMPRMWWKDDFDPATDDDFEIVVADYECSVGVVGTGFWRAPEMLRGVKNLRIDLSLFTNAANVLQLWNDLL